MPLFTVGAAPVWGEFLGLRFPFVEVVVEGCCVRLVLLVARVCCWVVASADAGASAAGGLRNDGCTLSQQVEDED